MTSVPKAEEIPGGNMLEFLILLGEDSLELVERSVLIRVYGELSEHTKVKPRLQMSYRLYREHSIFDVVP